MKISFLKAVCKTAVVICLFTFYGFHSANAQCKSYKLVENGDTLNCIDMKGIKQGKWIEHTAALRGNPGFEEEGTYINGQRTGLWRKYNLSGDVLSMENYRWGLLHGKAQYFTIDGLEREENWLALDPDKKYDTIDVPDFDKPDTYHQVIIKNDGRSLRHGKWTFYEPRTGFIKKSESYVRDSLDNPLAMFGIKPRTGAATDTSGAGKKVVKKTAEMEAWEKKNAGKKKVKVRDGRTF